MLLAGSTSAKDARLTLEFELWRDLIRTDRRAMARLIVLTGFSPDALAAFGAKGASRAVEDIMQTADRSGMAGQVELDLALDVSDKIAGIWAPTMVIGGTHDHIVAPSYARRGLKPLPMRAMPKCRPAIWRR